MYYGAASLSKALTLLRLDGSFSFDALREANKHQHHGLDLHGVIKDTKRGNVTMTLWLSDDDRRIPLRLAITLDDIHVTAELIQS